MSRDRLAALRNQRQQEDSTSTYSQPQGSYNDNSSYQPSPQASRSLVNNNSGGLPSGPRGGGNRRPSQDDYNKGSQYPPSRQEYGRPSGRQNENMEMREVNSVGGKVGRDSIIIGGGGIEAFFDNVSTIQSRIRDLSSSIQEFDGLQTRLTSLPASAEPSVEQSRLSQQMNSMSSEIRASMSKIKSSITRLIDETKKMAKSPGAVTQEDVDLRTNQIKTLQKRFVGVVEEYAAVEKKGRDATKKKLERQVLIVNPNLSEVEVKQAVDAAISGESEGGIFSQALMSNSQRLGAATSTLSEVRSRQEDIRRIETTLVELAQMFNDMAILIDQQDVQIRAIEETVINVNTDMEKGVQELKTAVVSARSARKKRVWCFFIFLIVILVVGGIVAYEILKNKSSSSSSSSSS